MATAVDLASQLAELQRFSEDNGIDLLPDLQQQLAAIRGHDNTNAAKSETNKDTTTSEASAASPEAAGTSDTPAPAPARVADDSFDNLVIDPAWHAPSRTDDTSDEEDDHETEYDGEDDHEVGYRSIAMTEEEFRNFHECIAREEDQTATAPAPAQVDEQSEAATAPAIPQPNAAPENNMDDGSPASESAAAGAGTAVATPSGPAAGVLPEETGFDRFALPVIFKAGTTGFEDKKDYRPKIGDVIAGRYLVKKPLDEAAFSVALRCVDLHAPILDASGSPNADREVCLKVVKNNKDYFDQSLDEIKLLTVLNLPEGPNSQDHILRLFDYFYFKEHLIISTELLGPNLYEFSKRRRKLGLPNVFADIRNLQKVANQILDGLVRAALDRFCFAVRS